MKYKTIKITEVIPDPDQPRKYFSDTEASELISSIKTQGILTPLVVESNYDGDKYLLLDGERRYRAATSIGLSEVPIEILEGPLSVEERTQKRFHIQEQHANWTELDKARAIYEYQKNTKKSVTAIAHELNIHIPKVHAYLSVTKFTEAGNGLIIKHGIDFTHLIFLIRIVKYYLTITDLTQEQIEEQMIKKIVSGTFKNVATLQLFSKMISKKGFEELKKTFLETDDFTFDEFKEKTTLNEKGDAYRYKKVMELFDAMLTESSEKTHLLDDTHKELLHGIKEKLETILS